MICRIINIDNKNDWLNKSQWLKSRTNPALDVENSVKFILETVKSQGDKALYEYARKFDCPDLKGSLKVSESELHAALEKIPDYNRQCIEDACANIKQFHESQTERSWFITKSDGSILGQMVKPVDAAGLYVPGGKSGSTPLISSLLMNAIPAIIAGCKRIAVVSPSRPDGSLDDNLLAAAAILGITEVYRVGGAWSIAALAYGTETIKPVDVIAGPGNIYVATAKRLLQGQVGIDMIAGPSEVLVICDNSANPSWIAADMLSQAEHDLLASAICLTDNAGLASKIENQLARQLDFLPRKEIARESLNRWGCIGIVRDMNLAIAIANLIAPEHLEICTVNPWDLLPKINHAGAIFLGNFSPEPIGDYFAGPNHVLPTLGTARFSSALSVQTFCKKSSILAASEEFTEKNASKIALLARMEGLEAHARSVEKRIS